MKKILLLCFLPILSVAQTQIGNNINGEAAGDRSGTSVSISADGTVVAIGAPWNDGIGNNNGGHVRVYQNIGGNWTQIGADIDGEAPNDQSGMNVSLSADGTVVAIGAPWNDGNGNDAGHVRVYQNIAGNWTQIGEDIEGVVAGDQSSRGGLALSADGNVVAIGSHTNNENGLNAGHVRVFQNNSGTWTQVGANISGEGAGDFSGWGVSLSADGSVVAIGSRNNNNGNGANAGHVRVFQNNGGTWTQVGANIDGEGAGDQSGMNVSLSSDGTVVAIGAHTNDGNGTDAGHVRVFQNNAGAWTQVGTDIDGEAAFDQSGYSVSLSANGNIVAIGAVLDDGSGTNAGYVKVFQNIAGTWTQVGSKIVGQAPGDLSGWSVSLNSDGTVVAIGARHNNGNGNNSGHVRVFDLSAVLSTNQLVQANFSVFPNPTSNYITIQLNEGLEFEKVNVYSTSGQLIKTELNTVISLKGLAKGSYFLEVFTNQGKASKTIIIK